MGPTDRKGTFPAAAGRAGSMTPVALLALLLLVPYLQLLAMHWLSSSSHAMASLLALAAAVVIGWRERPSAVVSRPPGAGLTVLALCTLAYALSLTVLTWRTLVGTTATALVACIVYLRHGRPGLVALRFPLLLAVLAVPFPGRLLETVGYHLVGLASSLGSTVLSWLVSGVTRQGSVIFLAGHGSVEVVADCNGLDGVLLFLPIALTLVYFQPQLSNLAKAAILALAVPLALLGNLLRIVVTGLLQVHHPDLSRSEVLHQVIGFLSLGLGLLILLALPRMAGRRRGAEALP